MKRMTRVAHHQRRRLSGAERGHTRRWQGAFFEKLGSNVEVFGMYAGYRGLADGDYKFMEPKDFSGILTQGGTILGTSRQRYIPRQGYYRRKRRKHDPRHARHV